MTLTRDERVMWAWSIVLGAVFLLFTLVWQAKAERWVVNYLNEDGEAFLPDSTQIEIYRPNGASWTLMKSFYQDGVDGLSTQGASVFGDYQADPTNYAGEWYYNVLTFVSGSVDTTTFWKTITLTGNQVGVAVRTEGYSGAQGGGTLGQYIQDLLNYTDTVETKLIALQTFNNDSTGAVLDSLRSLITDEIRQLRLVTGGGN